jgi:hypothetical protein
MHVYSKAEKEKGTNLGSFPQQSQHLGRRPWFGPGIERPVSEQPRPPDGHSGVLREGGEAAANDPPCCVKIWRKEDVVVRVWVCQARVWKPFL